MNFDIENKYKQICEKYKKKIVEMIVVSAIVLLLLLLSVFISKRPFVCYLIFNIVLSISYSIYIIYSLRNPFHELKLLRKTISSMLNSDEFKEYLYFEKVIVDYQKDGLYVNKYVFNTNNQERVLYSFNDLLIDLKENELYVITSLNNFILNYYEKEK